MGRATTLLASPKRALLGIVAPNEFTCGKVRQLSIRVYRERHNPPRSMRQIRWNKDPELAQPWYNTDVLHGGRDTVQAQTPRERFRGDFIVKRREVMRSLVHRIEGVQRASNVSVQRRRADSRALYPSPSAATGCYAEPRRLPIRTELVTRQGVVAT